MKRNIKKFLTILKPRTPLLIISTVLAMTFGVFQNCGRQFKYSDTLSTVGDISAFHGFSVLHSFNPFPNGAQPVGSFTASLDGATYYGVTSSEYGPGTIFSIPASGGNPTFLHKFVNNEGDPYPGLTLSGDGSTLFGTTAFGGASEGGSVFSIPATGGALTVLHTFDGLCTATEGCHPSGALTLSTNGSTLFGMTKFGGAHNHGSVFSIPTSGSTLTTLHDFGSNGDGAYPNGGLTLSSNGGTLYGMTTVGGANNLGTVFDIPVTGGTLATLYSFSTADGTAPYGSLTLSADGNTLFGMTNQGGVNNKGTVFSIPKTGVTLTKLHDFGGVGDGANPTGSLILSGGILYGTTGVGGTHNNSGTIFSIPAAGGTITLLHDFGSGTDGAQPGDSLVLSADGDTLSGITDIGGTDGVGTLFSIPLAGGSFTFVYNFMVVDGGYPYSDLTLSDDGSTLFGVTNEGGAHNLGMIFSMPITGGTPTVLHSFDSTNGFYPNGTLILSEGVLYGATQQGGANNKGTIFSIPEVGGSLTTLHSFNGTDGTYPNGSLILSQGVLYGITEQGGLNNKGTIFSLPAGGGSLTPLHTFDGTSGSYPSGTLILSQGVLYGMTQQGGQNNNGTIFSIPVGGSTLTTLHHFAAAVSGASPEGSLLFSDGILYGMTSEGGANGIGTIFSIPAVGGGLTVLHDFSAFVGNQNSDGAYPSGNLFLSNGVLYGMTNEGGTGGGYGTIFSISKSGGSFKALHSFELTDGASPDGSLIFSKGIFYGMASGGGFGFGTVFRYAP